MRIWVTRTAPDNDTTTANLEALGHEVVSVPVLQVRVVEAEPLCTAPDAIVFTSSNGVRYHPLSPEMLDVPVFAVGSRTAREASRAGYRNVSSANGDITALQWLILDQLSPPCRLVHFGAAKVAGNLSGFLRRYGYLVDQRTVYAAQAVAVRWLLDVRTALPNIDGIVVHSPRGADRVARVLSGTGWRGKIWCISEACARKLACLPDVQLYRAFWPTEASVMEMVRQSGVLRMPARALMRVVAGNASRIVESGPEPANDNDEPPVDDLRTDGGPDDDPPSAA